MYIGIVGALCAGKTTTARILERNGFRVIRLSDILREKAEVRKLEPSEEALLSLGNEMRLKFGPAALMDEALNRAPEEQCAFDCILSREELERLRSEGGIVMGIEADPKTRYERAVKRQRENGLDEYYGSLQQFLEEEAVAERLTQQQHLLLDYTDVRIENNGTIEELSAAILAEIDRLAARSSGGE